MAVANPAAPPDARRLTTHVLDTSTGHPAAGLTLQLLRIEGESRTLLTTAATRVLGLLVLSLTIALGVTIG